MQHKRLPGLSSVPNPVDNIDMTRIAPHICRGCTAPTTPSSQVHLTFLPVASLSVKCLPGTWRLWFGEPNVYEIPSVLYPNSRAHEEFSSAKLSHHYHYSLRIGCCDTSMCVCCTLLLTCHRGNAD